MEPVITSGASSQEGQNQTHTLWGLWQVTIDKETGKFMWQLPGGTELLAESAGKAYVITNTGRLVVMDNAGLKQLYSVNFAAVSRYVANTTDSNIYIGDDD